MPNLKRANLTELNDWTNLWGAEAYDCRVELETNDQNLEVFVRPFKHGVQFNDSGYWAITVMGVELVDRNNTVLKRCVREIPRAINL